MLAARSVASRLLNHVRSPLDPSLGLDLMAGAAHYDLGAGGNILIWHDLSSYRFDPYQPITELQPTPDPASVNGRDAVRFVLTNGDHLFADGFSTWMNGTDRPLTVALVMQGLGGGVTLAFSSASTTNTVHTFESPASTGTGKHRSFRRSDAGGGDNVAIESTQAVDTAQAHVYLWLFNGTALTLRVDGAATSIANATMNLAGTVQCDRLVIGAQKLGAGAVTDPCAFRLCRLRIWSRTLSSTEYLAEEAALKAAYGTP